MNGICTLANDRVYDQLVALLNSIEAILGTEIPVCIYPFDEQLERISAEIKQRSQVFIYEDRASIQRWDRFMQIASPQSVNRKYRIYGGHRRFCAFDGPFDNFVYMDADTLLMNSLDNVFQRLNEYDCVVYDFQFYHPDKVYNLQSKRLFKVFEPEQIQSQIFCSGFYGSKRNLFTQEKIEYLLSEIKKGEAEILYPTGDQPVLNYMFMRSGIPIYNFAYHLPDTKKTGSSVTSKHFEEQDKILYDKGNRLTYIHYIGISPSITEAVCLGENIEFPYRDLFLHYRYLHAPEKRPVFSTASRPYTETPNLFNRLVTKFKLNRRV